MTESTLLRSVSSKRWYRKREIQVAVGTITIILLVALLPLSFTLFFKPRTTEVSLRINYVPFWENLTQVVLRVEYGGSWTGYYADKNHEYYWNGNGSRSVNAYSPVENEEWFLVASAWKTDSSGGILKISITKTDGSILEQARTTESSNFTQVIFDSGGWHASVLNQGYRLDFSNFGLRNCSIDCLDSHTWLLPLYRPASANAWNLVVDVWKNDGSSASLVAMIGGNGIASTQISTSNRTEAAHLSLVLN